MGCGCQGSTWQPAEVPAGTPAPPNSPQGVLQGLAPTGPAAPGYFWRGPEPTPQPAGKE